MIKSFKYKGLEKLFHEGSSKGIQNKHKERLLNILDLLDAADFIPVMRFPDSNLHKLEPKKDGIWAIKEAGNWRVTFQFTDGDAFYVNYLDYH